MANLNNAKINSGTEIIEKQFSPNINSTFTHNKTYDINDVSSCPDWIFENEVPILLSSNNNKTIFEKITEMFHNSRHLAGLFGTNYSISTNKIITSLISEKYNSLKSISTTQTTDSNKVPSSSLINQMHNLIDQLETSAASINLKLQVVQWTGSNESWDTSGGQILACNITFDFAPDIVCLFSDVFADGEVRKCSRSMGYGAIMNNLSTSFEYVPRTMVISDIRPDNEQCKCKKSSDGKTIYWYNSTGHEMYNDTMYDDGTYCFIGIKFE